MFFLFNFHFILYMYVLWVRDDYYFIRVMPFFFFGNKDMNSTTVHRKRGFGEKGQGQTLQRN